jgi:hypothetical protein
METWRFLIVSLILFALSSGLVVTLLASGIGRT